jgi:hypothetical protein
MFPPLKFLAAAFGCQLVLAVSVVAQDAGVPSTGGPRLRGFNVPELSPKNLADMKTAWHANSVRYHMPISQIAQREGISMAEAWKKVIAGLPAGLDAAKEHGITVIIGMPQNGIFQEDPKLTHDENLSVFWENDANLQMMIECWKEIANITKGRPEEIWLDIFNEPLDRKDLPACPKKWPDWAQQIVDAIRTIEPLRPIVVEPGPGGLDWGFANFPLLKGGNIIYSPHSYSPHAYTHQGIASLERTDLAQAYLKTGRGWPGDFPDQGEGYWNKARLEKGLSATIEFQKRHPGARIYVGEFSAIRWAPNADQYLRDSIEIFEKYGWDWSYHGFREYTGWSLEHDEAFSAPEDAKPAQGTTARGAVVRHFLERNNVLEPMTKN